MTSKPAYSVTINLPEELQDQLEDITNKYIDTLGDKIYIQSYEDCKNGKKHSHIGYMSVHQKTTSNETKKFNSCYTFDKKEHPCAIMHKKHTDFDLLVSYILKDNTLEEIRTNIIDTEYLKKMKVSYKPPKKKLDNNIYTVNQIGDLFVTYYQEYIDNNDTRITTPEYDNHIINAFLKGIKAHIKFNTYMKIKRGALIEFAKFNYTSKIQFI